jgi:hypothetical protein
MDRLNRKFAGTHNPSDDDMESGQVIYDNCKYLVMTSTRQTFTSEIPVSSFSNLRVRPRPTGTKATLPGPLNLKSKRHISKWMWSLFLRAPLQGTEMVGLNHPQLFPL